MTCLPNIIEYSKCPLPRLGETLLFLGVLGESSFRKYYSSFHVTLGTACTYLVSAILGEDRPGSCAQSAQVLVISWCQTITVRH